VLAGSYSHPVSKATMLTPQLRISLRNWAGAGLLSQPLVRERLIFIQELRAQHCDMLDGQHFRVVGNAANVGIPTAQNYLMREASSSHVLFLERDYVTVDPRPVVEDHVRFALEMLRGPRMHNRGAVLLRAQEQSGVSEEQTRRLRSQGLVCQAQGSSLSTNVCENQTTLRAAFATDFATDFTPTTTGGVGFEPTTSGAVAAAAGGGAWRFEAELCQAHATHRWDPPGLFYTTLSAMESCPERLLAAQDELMAAAAAAESPPALPGSRQHSEEPADDPYTQQISRCSAKPAAFCLRSANAHWSGRPHIVARAFYQAEIRPHIPDCTDPRLTPTPQARKFCNYLGVESNTPLQCHLRSLNYTIVLTGGGFRHMTKCYSQAMEACAAGLGYTEREEGLELCATWSIWPEKPQVFTASS
jgi:hypothetical protein